MLAYVFWHAAPAEVPGPEYEANLLRFGDALRNARISGVVGCASYATSPTPWLGEAGYEDWTWLEGSWVLDVLNEKAVSGSMEGPHRDISSITKHGGYGALYYLVGGEHEPEADSTVIWLSRPRGINWRDVLPTILGSANAKAVAWRRQMVLGPSGSAEFAIIGPPRLSVTVPNGWKSVTTERRRINPASR